MITQKQIDVRDEYIKRLKTTIPRYALNIYSIECEQAIVDADKEAAEMEVVK